MLADYTSIKKKRYDFGTVQVSLEMSNEIIKDISIQGDFFGVEDISVLENLLKGKSVRDIDTLIEQIDIDKYIFGATRDEFVRLIKE
jgi:lipoate-protein ligase A